MTCLVYFGINHPASTVDCRWYRTFRATAHISEIIWLLRLLPYWNPNRKSYENPNPVHLPTPEAWRKWCNCDASTPLDSLKVTNPKPRCLWQPTDASSGMNSVLDGLTLNVHSLLYVLYKTIYYYTILLYQGAWMHDSKSSYYSHLGVHVRVCVWQTCESEEIACTCMRNRRNHISLLSLSHRLFSCTRWEILNPPKKCVPIHRECSIITHCLCVWASIITLVEESSEGSAVFSNYTLVQYRVASLSLLKYLLNLKCRDPKRLRLDGWTRHDSMFIPIYTWSAWGSTTASWIAPNCPKCSLSFSRSQVAGKPPCHSMAESMARYDENCPGKRYM